MVDNNFDSLPWLDLFSKRLDNMPNLSGSDVDNNLLHQINFLITIRYLAFIEVIV